MPTLKFPIVKDIFGARQRSERVYPVGGGDKNANDPDAYKRFHVDHRAVVPMTIANLDEAEIPDNYSYPYEVDAPFLKLNQPQYSQRPVVVDPESAINNDTPHTRMMPLLEVIQADSLDDTDANPIYGSGDTGFISPAEAMLRGY